MLDRLRPFACRMLAAAVVAVCAAGCADVALQEEAQRRPRRGPESGPLREHWLGQAWSGRTRDVLERDWGAPSFVLEMPGFAAPDRIVLVFVGRDRIGGCIDAFVVLKDDAQTIWTYVCR